MESPAKSPIKTRAQSETQTELFSAGMSRFATMNHIGFLSTTAHPYIMRTSKFWSFITISAVTIATPLIVSAQSTPPSKDFAPAPPQTQRLEEGEAPAVTIRQPDTQKKITEKKSQGKVTEVKVQTGRTTYYAKPNDTAGAMRGDGQSDTNRPVQFEVGTFGGPKTAPAPDPVQTLAPAPAPVK
jgi:hypothetical protein